MVGAKIDGTVFYRLFQYCERPIPKTLMFCCFLLTIYFCEDEALYEQNGLGNDDNQNFFCMGISRSKFKHWCPEVYCAERKYSDRNNVSLCIHGFNRVCKSCLNFMVEFI